MEWIDLSKTYRGTQPESNSVIMALDGFYVHLKRDTFDQFWILSAWGNGIHLEDTNLKTKDLVEATGKAIPIVQDRLKSKMNYLVKLMNTLMLSKHKKVTHPIKVKKETDQCLENT